jgi:hypothetical protein
VIIARGVFSADSSAESCRVMFSGAGDWLFSIHTVAFRMLAGFIPVVFIGAGLGRFRTLEVENPIGRRK